MKGEAYSFEEVVIAALLHDIGKFSQRTGMKELSDTSMEGHLCKLHRSGSYYTHQHVLFTYRAIELMKDIFPRSTNYGNIQKLAGAHHNPSSAVESIITRADWISSGADRTTAELEGEAKKQYYETPLQSIFSSVDLGEGTKESRNRVYYSINPLSPEDAFPLKEVHIGREDYRNLWDTFMTDTAHLSGTSFEHFLGALDTMLEQYTWCIPSSTIDQPDISLYDHLKTTAAFSAALYRYHEEEGTLDSENAIANQGAKKFLLLSGDISGIQKYIFDLKTQKGSAKSLRARSFEIQYLEQTTARAILQRCGIPSCCSLWNAGGRFLLVLPNTETVRKKVDETRLAVERYFLKRFFGTLSLNISDGLTVSATDLSQKKAVDLFKLVSRDVAGAKQKKLKGALEAEGHILGHEYEKIVGNAVCPACGIRASDGRNEDGWCGDCARLRNIGGKLPKARFMAFFDGGTGKESADLQLDRIILEGNAEDIPGGFTACSINEYIPGYPLYRMPYHVPMKPGSGEVMEFSEIAEEALGDKKIAMLKADLDNLGAVFGFGLGKVMSISRFATMSRMLNYFFTSWIHRRLENNGVGPPFSNLYIVFSGGDDLCLIGPWDRVVDFSLEVQREFSRFTGSNPNLHISAGISLSGPSVPVGHISARAEGLLDDAKDREGKNAVTLFDTVMSWNTFSRMIEEGKHLVDLMEGKQGGPAVGHGIVYRLIDYRRRFRRFKEGKISDRNALWKSNFVYDTARNLKELPEAERTRFISLADEKNIEYIAVPASYALYGTRHKKERNDEH